MIVEKITVEMGKYRNNLKGFDVERYTRYLISRIEHRRLFKSTKNKRTLEKYKLIKETGIPDFFYIEEDKIKFIECKDYLDGLKFNQLKWIQKNQENVRVIFLKIINTKSSKSYGKVTSWEKYYGGNNIEFIYDLKCNPKIAKQK